MVKVITQVVRSFHDPQMYTVSIYLGYQENAQKKKGIIVYWYKKVTHHNLL